MIIRKANRNEFKNVKDFYYEIIDQVKFSEYELKWEKNIYPSDSYLKESIDNKRMFIGVDDGEVISAMIIDNESTDEKINWKTKSALNIHILAVHPNYRRQGCAKKMLMSAVDLAMKNKIRAIHLDVCRENTQAKKLYINLGFNYIDSFEKFYERTGTMIFDAYELEIN